jgi:hypothetical protein
MTDGATYLSLSTPIEGERSGARATLTKYFSLTEFPPVGGNERSTGVLWPY